MKNILLLLSLIQILTAQSQVNISKSQNKKDTFEPGVYTSNAKGQNIKLTINPDKTYDMSFFFGNYEVKNDTIYFRNSFQNSQKFVVKPVNDAPYSSTLKLKLNYDLSYYYSTEIYIGTQSDENRKVSYKLLKDYFKDSNTVSNTDSTQQNIDIEKSKYLYIVDAKYNTTTVFKFQIPESVNEAEIEYNPYTNSETKLSGYIDSISNEFVISDGKTPILFDFQKSDAANPKIKTDLQAIDIKIDNNWTKENGFLDYSVDQTVAAAYAPSYVFKHKIATSLSNAQSEIKKTPNKFLIVVYDPKNKKSKSEFDDFIKTSEESISSYMYSEYNATYDNFNFYLATDKDKSLLSKNNITSDQEIVVLNNNGEMVYHTKGSLKERKDDFSIYNTIYKEIQSANEKLEFDKVMSAKNQSVQEIKSSLRKILNSESAYATMPPTVDAVKFTPPTIKLDENSPPVVIEEKVSYETVVDTAVAATEVYDNYYDIIKDKDNLYKSKSTKEAVITKWKKVVNNFKNSKTYDKEFVQVLKAELAGTGFMQGMFPATDYNSTDLDFEMLDYVYTNFNMLLNPPAEKVLETVEDEVPVISSYDYSYYYEQDLKTVINAYFTRSNYAQNTQIDKVLKYYKKYLDISGYDGTAVQNYMSALSLNINSGNNKQEYLETYEKYFNSIVKENTSIIENLDAAFTVKPISDYGDWTTYKNSFANLANDVCWYLVQNSNDALYLKKAIKWSETSLLIEKNNHYYLDTLAQIYYKNGDKQKAITTEQKAIDANTDGEENIEYKSVLEKMKNGTY